MLKKLSFVLLAVLLLASCKLSDKELAEMNIVKNVDLEKYAGTWYEISRLPNRFEKDLVGVTATYTLRDNGKVGVLNQGYKNSLDGKLKKAKGFAKVPDKKNPGYLKVYFFWPFGADYFILELDKENYQYALVGSSTKDYLWILSRTPQLEKNTYEMLVEKAKERGYDVSQLMLVKQRGN